MLIKQILMTTCPLVALSCSTSSFNGPAKSAALTPQSPAPADPAPAPVPVDSSTAPKEPEASAPQPPAIPPPPPNINFGLMVSDLNCTLCHLEVHGTVVSLGAAAAVRSDSYGKVFGKWLAAGAFHALDAISTPPLAGGVTISGGSTANYDNAGKEMPVDPTTKLPAFPSLDFGLLPAKMQGSVKATAGISAPTSISKTYSSNTVLVGTAAEPIVIERDVLIQGDLVIKGVYSGVGTLYVTGNIYIPGNLKASKPASLPYPDDPVEANTVAKADLASGGKDALGLATAKSIFIGDLENYMDAGNGANNARGTGIGGAVRYNSLYTNDPGTLYDGTLNGVWNVYSWLAEPVYQTLYETTTTPCWTTSNRPLVAGHAWGERAWTQIDAYLYSLKAIAGISRASNWTLNGGMIAQSMHIVSGAGTAAIAAPNTCGPSRINFDYRLQNGLQVLEQLGSLFPSK